MLDKHPHCRVGKKVLLFNKLNSLIFFTVVVVLIILLLVVGILTGPRWEKMAIGDGNFNLLLAFGRLFVFNGQKLIWLSPGDWQVKDFLVGDLDYDGQSNLNLVVFNHQPFGQFRPFWVKEERKFSCHFYMLEILPEKVDPLWQSSRLEKPICQAWIDDLDGDGDGELVVEEGAYRKNGYSCADLSQTVWQWNGWGFSRMDGD